MQQCRLNRQKEYNVRDTVVRHQSLETCCAYMRFVDAVEVRFRFEARQSHQLGSVFQTGKHDGHHAVNVEERQDANERLLEGEIQPACAENVPVSLRLIIILKMFKEISR